MTIEQSDLRLALTPAWWGARDARGLMPVEVAREYLSDVRSFVYTDAVESFDGRAVLDTDKTWSALLSLADAAEFVEYATRIEWDAHVRGMENVSAFQRYGDGVLPWIASRIDDDGILHNVPWCLLPCLLESDSSEAFSLAARIRGVKTHRPGDPPWTTDYFDPAGTAREWVNRHPKTGYRLLADGSAGTVEVLRVLFDADPAGTRRRLRASLGAEVADRLLADHGLRVPKMPAEVRRILADTPSIKLPKSDPLTMADLGLLWQDAQGPAWDNAAFFTAAMRLYGYVTPFGADGVVFQSLTTGMGEDDLRIEFHLAGFGEPPGPRPMHALTILTERQIAAGGKSSSTTRFEVPGGTIALQLRPDPLADGLSTAERVALAMSTSADDRDRIFLGPLQVKQRLDLPDTSTAILGIDQWQHPALDQSPATSPDLTLVVEALRRRKTITRRVSTTTWLDHIEARRRLYIDPD